MEQDSEGYAYGYNYQSGEFIISPHIWLHKPTSSASLRGYGAYFVPFMEGPAIFVAYTMEVTEQRLCATISNYSSTMHLASAACLSSLLTLTARYLLFR